ncbi:hypothetical protein MRX96_046884 [Rhipicephalus microplus]
MPTHRFLRSVNGRYIFEKQRTKAAARNGEKKTLPTLNGECGEAPPLGAEPRREKEAPGVPHAAAPRSSRLGVSAAGVYQGRSRNVLVSRSLQRPSPWPCSRWALQPRRRPA